MFVNFFIIFTGEESRNVKPAERIKRPSSVSSSHASTESLISPRSPSPKNLNHVIQMLSIENVNWLLFGVFDASVAKILYRYL